MGRIFYIMGKSSSGKDTVYNKLLEDQNLKLRNIVMYTTRPLRAGEKNGREYFFTDEDELLKLKKSGKLIEVREYQTIFGIWKYFTANDEQMDLKNHNYLVIGTLESYEKLSDYYGEQNIEPIYIEVDDGIRLQRALDRERSQDQPGYSEMCRRYLADEEDFSEANIARHRINKRFCNMDLKNCLKEIEEHIKKFN